jgi:transcriptional regulator with XRE-family HTH domain
MISMAEQETSYALSDLVKRRRAELRLSLRKFAETCIDPETGIQEIKHAWVERLEKRQNVTPLQLPELRALRAGLKVPMGDVQDAAGEQFFGIFSRDADAAGNIRVLMNRAADLSPEDLARLVSIAEALPISTERPGESSK